MAFDPAILVNPKLLSLPELAMRRATYAARGQRVVLTNGCFDLLHAGHLHFLQQAKAQGEALFVALNGDASVRALKGPHRPILSQGERAYALAALACVDAVVLFHTPRLTDEIVTLRPDVYVKAADYTLDSLNPEEREALEQAETDIRFLPFLAGYSTTDLIRRMAVAASISHPSPAAS